jgi:protein-disulfide isomerase
MLENLSAKQGFVFGLVTGLGASAILACAVMLPSVLGKGNNTISQTYSPNQLATQQQAVDTGAQQQVPTNIPKSDKPKVELFVMSNCPYGLQMEKAYVPAYDLLKNKADMTVKFVSYIMHGKDELDENTRQYCAQEQDRDKYYAYLKCYASSQDSAGYMKLSGLNESKINSCVDKTNKKFAILDKYNDQTTWLSGRYPLYPIHEDLNNKYGVQGSPTLVINGVQVESGRTPEAIKSTICAAFNNPPSECSQTLALASPQPGFGTGTTQETVAAGCGG